MSTHNLCFEKKYEKYQNFLSENFPFLVVKFSVYLNRRVFVMRLDRLGGLSSTFTRELYIMTSYFKNNTRTSLFKYTENLTTKK